MESLAPAGLDTCMHARMHAPVDSAQLRLHTHTVAADMNATLNTGAKMAPIVDDI